MRTDAFVLVLMFILFCLTPLMLCLIVFYLHSCMKFLKVIAEDIRKRHPEGEAEASAVSPAAQNKTWSPSFFGFRKKVSRDFSPVSEEQMNGWSPQASEVSVPAAEERTADVMASEVSPEKMKTEPEIPSVADNRKCRWNFPQTGIFEIVRKRLNKLKNWFCYGQLTGEQIAGERREQLAASTWLMRGGILISLFTAAFLLKLSVQYGLLAPVWRVVLTIVSGGVLILWGLRCCRGRYARLGQTFAGIGLALFYFAAMAADSMYGLLPPAFCGAFMILVTAAAGMIADRLSSLGLALIAIVGGYCTPLMLGGGPVNYSGLFAYMLILGGGVIWLSWRQNWVPLQWLGMLGTYVLYFSVFNAHFMQEAFSVFQISLVLFFLQYTLAFGIYQLKRCQPFTILETWSFLIHSFVFFGMNWLLLEKMDFPRLSEALLPLLLSLFYMAIVYLMFCRRHRDRLLLISCIGLSALYLSLTFPVALSGKWLGASWALQALLMVWLGFSLNSAFTRRMGWALFGICLIRLCFWDLSSAQLVRYGSQEYFWRAFLERMLGYLIPILSLAGASWLEKHPPVRFESAVEEDQAPERHDGQWELLPLRLVALGALLLFIYLNFEVRNVCGHVWAPLEMPARLWLWGIGAVALVRFDRELGMTSSRIRRTLLWILLLGMIYPMVFCFFFGGLSQLFNVRSFSWTAESCRLFSIASIAFFLRELSCLLRKQESKIARWASIVWPVLLFLHLTHDVNMITSCCLTGFRGGGVSILWSIFAFVLVYRGLCLRSRRLRYSGLALFLVVMLKVLFSDLAFLDAVYRIVAFFLFGLLLIGGSWLYMKLWKSGVSEGKEMKS